MVSSSASPSRARLPSLQPCCSRTSRLARLIAPYGLTSRTRSGASTQRATIVYVTHDREEALALSDRIAVIREGKLIQLGSGEELYAQLQRLRRTPSPECNVFPSRASQSQPATWPTSCSTGASCARSAPTVRRSHLSFGPSACGCRAARAMSRSTSKSTMRYLGEASRLRAHHRVLGGVVARLDPREARAGHAATTFACTSIRATRSWSRAAHEMGRRQSRSQASAAAVMTRPLRFGLFVRPESPWASILSDAARPRRSDSTAPPETPCTTPSIQTGASRLLDGGHGMGDGDQPYTDRHADQQHHLPHPSALGSAGGERRPHLGWAPRTRNRRGMFPTDHAMNGIPVEPSRTFRATRRDRRDCRPSAPRRTESLLRALLLVQRGGHGDIASTAAAAAVDDCREQPTLDRPGMTADSWNTYGGLGLTAEQHFEYAAERARILDECREQVGRHPEAIRRSILVFSSRPLGINRGVSKRRRSLSGAQVH